MRSQKRLENVGHPRSELCPGCILKYLLEARPHPESFRAISLVKVEHC